MAKHGQEKTKKLDIKYYKENTVLQHIIEWQDIKNLVYQIWTQQTQPNAWRGRAHTRQISCLSMTDTAQLYLLFWISSLLKSNLRVSTTSYILHNLVAQNARTIFFYLEILQVAYVLKHI